jgi:voltage-gated potassium channel Kch
MARKRARRNWVEFGFAIGLIGHLFGYGPIPLLPLPGEMVLVVVTAVVLGHAFWVALTHRPEHRALDREYADNPRVIIPLGVAAAWFLWAIWVVGAAAGIDWLMSTTYPQAFSQSLSRIDAIYFAVATFTTTGYGDIQAVSQGARLLVSVQMLAGFAVVAVGLAAALSGWSPAREGPS